MTRVETVVFEDKPMN